MFPADLAVPSIDHPRNWCIHSLIATWADRTPDSIAIAAPGRSPLTYSRLRIHIEDTVETLNSMGVGRNDRVAIVLPNGPEMAVAFAAIVSGATCAPLNPAYSASEFDFYLPDLNAKTLITQSGMDSPAIAVAKERGIPIIELSPMLKAEAGIFTLTGDKRSHPSDSGLAQPDDVALVLHTSGTTSRPKIVPLTHTNICASLHSIAASLRLVESDRCLNVMPLFHVHGLICGMLSSLVTGASVVCTPGFHALRFFEWMEYFRPTWYTAVPTMHQAILMHAAVNSDIIARCPLRFIRSASAPLPPQVMLRLESIFNAPVVESYAMTESATYVTINPLPPGERKPGSVGIAKEPEVAIMDDAGNFLPQGKTGEIVIRGRCVMHGYENNPEANEKAFTKGWFRTGDQGYLDTDGYLFITGRLKEIINRGGEKIAPREVDDVIMDHPAVAQVVTFAVPHAQLGEDVAAAIILRENASTTEREIQKFVAARLADFKVPRQVLIVDEMPTGPTGKPLRIGLAEELGLTAQDSIQKAAEAEFVAPRNSIEEKLVDIWSQALDVDQMGVYDDFLELGGDSLQATQIISRVINAFQVDMSIRSLFQAPTVADMAAIITQDRVKKVECEDTDRIPAESEEFPDQQKRRFSGEESAKRGNGSE